MKVLLQKVSGASVKVDEKDIGSIGTGYLLLLGVVNGDTEEQAQWLAEKISKLRLFEGDDGKNYNIFGEGGVEKVAKDYKKEFLGKIPIDIDLRVAADSGKPLVEMNPDHKISKIFKEMASKVKGSFL